ncbi:MAG: glycosyltransferase [Chitinivibrionales bacterium]|nr:glycosyltransferase [Chitinivibrionales bacterium]
MKVLFVRSGNNGIDPITQNQGDSLVESGIKVVYFNIVGRGLAGYAANIPRLRKVIKTERPDLVHAHYYLSAFVAFLAGSTSPLVVSLMGSDVNNAGLFVRVVLRLASRRLWAATIVKSAAIAKSISTPVSVIPNGVNLDIVREIDRGVALTHTGWQKEAYNILFGADPARKEKNFDLARKSVALASTKRRNIALHCLMGVDRKDVKMYYSAADVLLLTSLAEGSPNVVKEAMACNCPIIATDVGDVRKVIGDTSFCYIVNFDAHEIAEKIDSILRRRVRTNGREKVAHLDSHKISGRILDLYRRVLEEGKVR